MLPRGILVTCSPPLGRYSLQAPSYIACGGVGGDWWRGEDIFPPAQSLQNTDVFSRLYAHRTYSDKTSSPRLRSPNLLG